MDALWIRARAGMTVQVQRVLAFLQHGLDESSPSAFFLSPPRMGDKKGLEWHQRMSPESRRLGVVH